jgi:hypothetical protein
MTQEQPGAVSVMQLFEQQVKKFPPFSEPGGS